ncbi:MAG: PilZ domain-containing protein [Myxococcota bacterium]
MGQRGYGRVDANVGVTLTLADGSTRRVDRLRNISLGGVFVEMQEPLSFGAEVELEFLLPRAREPVRCKGLVVRRELGQDGPGVGLKLLEIEPGDMRRVADFLEANL